jgi:hypothetical protein
MKKYQCNTVTETVDTNKFKLVVFFKKTNLFQCKKHSFIVVALIVNNVIESDSGKSLRHYLVKKVIPYCQHQLRTSCNYNKSKLPQKCHCQGKVKECQGFSMTSGCTRSAFSGGKCRYNKKLQDNPTGRFPVKGMSAKNKKSFEQKSIDTAKTMSSVLSQYAPLAFANMTKTEPNKCRLGDSAFCSMTIVADFTAHIHRDKNDVRNGATALLTLLKDEDKTNIQTQFHCLPSYRFKGSRKKGVSFKLNDCSVLLEVASMEPHSSSPIENPNGLDPVRMGLVFFSHSGLTLPDHGFKKIL